MRLDAVCVRLWLKGKNGQRISHKGKKSGQPGNLLRAFALGQGGGQGRCGGEELACIRIGRERHKKTPLQSMEKKGEGVKERI